MKTNIGGAASASGLPPDFSDRTILGPGVTSKHAKKTLKITGKPREAQRVKTRGPNPNPTAQAQSKRCLPLSTKTQNIIENVSISASILGGFLKHFPQKWLEGSRATPQSAHKTPTWTPRVPKWRPRVPQSAQKTPNYASGVSKWKAKVPQWSPKASQSAKETQQGPAKCHKDTHKCQQQAQLDTNKQ